MIFVHEDTSQKMMLSARSPFSLISISASAKAAFILLSHLNRGSAPPGDCDRGEVVGDVRAGDGEVVNVWREKLGDGVIEIDCWATRCSTGLYDTSAILTSMLSKKRGWRQVVLTRKRFRFSRSPGEENGAKRCRTGPPYSISIRASSWLVLTGLRVTYFGNKTEVLNGATEQTPSFLLGLFAL
jgi:hypothetical protein